MGLAEDLKYWAKSSPNNQRTLDFLLGQGKGLTDYSNMVGVDNVLPTPALKYSNAFGTTHPEVPRQVYLNPINNGQMGETLAHEAEHARQFSLSDEKLKRLNNPQFSNQMLFRQDGIPALNKLIDSLDSNGTTVTQPSWLERLAFLRGKESTGELPMSAYDKLEPNTRHFILSSLFANTDKALPMSPNAVTNTVSKQVEPSLLDLFRRRMRAFTSY